jgi:hypothetical protein
MKEIQPLPVITLESLKLANVFFSALEYPEYARPNYFIRNQKASGWSKGVYLVTLNEIYHAYVMRLQIHYGAKKRNSPGIKIEDIQLSPKEIDGVSVDKLVDKKLLDQLHLAVEAAWYIDRPEMNFTPYQILTFVETALIFIRKEFSEQIKKTNNFYPRPRTKSYFTYLISQDAPFFDFPKFKAAIRELILTSRNKDQLRRLLSQFHKVSVEIVKLWNEDIYFLERKSNDNENSQPPERALVEFHADTLKHSWWSSEEHFQIKPHDLFLNQDFAYYAANIANLINSDLLHGKETKVNGQAKDFTKDFLRGIQHLMVKNERQICIKNILEGKNWEGPFRDFFWDWFEGQNYATNSESERGNNYIDLKVEHISIGRKIIEFKGWWNRTKSMLVPQLFNYLTDFEGDGYIFIINHSKKPIVERYMKVVTGSDSGFIAKSWKPHSYKPTAFTYFTSKHQFNSQLKVVYHFIFNVHFPSRKQK